MNSDIRVIHCPIGRCEKCPQGNDVSCKKLHQIKKNIDEESQIMLVETGRGLIHFCETSTPKLTEPPWRTEGWETVFIGKYSSLFEELGNILAMYKTGPHLCVFTKLNNNQTKYITVPLVRTALESSLIEDLTDKALHFGVNTHSLKSITQKLKQMIEDISGYILDMIPEINKATRLRLSEIIAHRRSVLGIFMPLILDNFVEEIYLDRPGVPVYFDHQKYGRCMTTFTLQEHDVPKIITLIRAESNLHMDRGNPSLKMDLQIQDAVLRFSASMPPLSPDGLHLEIRRARDRPFSISELIENGTMTPEAAAILVFAVSCRFNITITGGPGTGKTTLLNALDMTTPKWWRKIYIEDTIESRSQSNHHQVRFRVDPIDEHLMKFSKSNEIIKCLHRSPDYLILGEIQTAEHSNALFQAITAGLRTIQTCHSGSASSLVSRWKLGHGILDDNLALMDIIVTLERPRPGESKRIVCEISEIRRKKVENGLFEFSGLNSVYEKSQGVSNNWADDGAFMTQARDLGVDSHVPALRNLTEIIRQDIQYSNLEMLSERMWSYGHPMKFIESSMR